MFGYLNFTSLNVLNAALTLVSQEPFPSLTKSAQI